MSSYLFEGRKRFWKPKTWSPGKDLRNQSVPQTRSRIGNTPKEWTIRQNNWNLPKIVKLLQLYRAHPCLWNPKDSDHRSRKLRRAALLDITSAIGSDVTKQQIVQKLNILRATYRYEKRRIRDRKKNGLGAKTKLKWFALADGFLRDIIKCESNEDGQNNSDLEDSWVVTEHPSALIHLSDEDFQEETFHKSKSSSEETGADFSVKADVVMSETEEKYEATLRRNSGESTKTEENPSSSKISLSPIVHVKEEPFENLKTHRQWSSFDSLKFVEFLLSNPKLFETSSCPGTIEDLKSLAEELHLPIERLAKRLKIFKKVIKDNLNEITMKPGYKPNYIWWPLMENYLKYSSENAENSPTNEEQNLSKDFKQTQSFSESFLEEENSPQTLNDSNEINKAPPVEEAKVNEVLEPHEESLHSNLEDFDDSDSFTSYPSGSSAPPLSVRSELPLDCSVYPFNDEYSYDANPISSVPPSSVSSSVFQEAFEDLFDPNHSDKERNSLSHFSGKTKIVLNALEDDLLEGKWSLKNSVKFLRLYGSHRCLWDLKDPDYRSRDLRYAAIKDIACEMGNGLDYFYVSKKIKIFRITYMQHRKRLLELIKLGKESDPQLRWFPLADSFLRPHIGLRSLKDEQEELPPFDLQYVYANLNLIDPTLLADFRDKTKMNLIKKKRK